MRKNIVLIIVSLVMFACLLSRCSITKETQRSLQDTNIRNQHKVDTTTTLKKCQINGLRRENLKSNNKSSTNPLTQSMLNSDSTIYKINYDYDLKGETITVPENCVLEFCGGSIKNGTLLGQNTNIKNESGDIIFLDVTFKGTYVQDYICSEWFDYNNLSRLFDAIQILATSDNLTRVEVKKMTTTYQTVVRNYYKGDKASYLFKIPSNTIVDFGGSVLTLAPNDISFFYAIYIKDVCNIEVKNLTLLGDIEGHTPTKYNEYSHGIYIYAAQNIKLENVISSKFWGDGMGISGYANSSMPYNNNIFVKNCDFVKNRRQGCSISKGSNLHFENCKFIETGVLKSTSPSAGVDIEPNNEDDIIKNITFDNCMFLGNEGNYGGVLIMTSKLANDLDAKEIKFSSCEIDGIHQYGKGGGYMHSCIISNSKNRPNCLNASKNLIVEDCIIKFKKENSKINILNNIKYVGNTFRIR